MSLQFVNHYAEHFADIITEQPISIKGPSQVRLFNTELWQQLGGSGSAQHLLEQINNKETPPDWRPLAQKYAGHQFGQFNPYLGDGRGLLLGEIKTPNGDFRDLHLKGAGPTPYGRGGDGRAVLRSSIREYLASEAMAALGIPTTRALMLLSSQDQVQRERPEPGAMMLRTAATHVRFGHFEHCYYRHLKNTQQQLWHYVIERHWPDLAGASAAQQFRRVMEHSAVMIALWQAYGFIHGVMNTDNMSLVGETFDYGPYAVLDTYQPEKIFNHTDQTGRYGFLQQPGIGLWNLQRLQTALSLSMDVNPFAAVLDDYEPYIQRAYLAQMQQRLGLNKVESRVSQRLIGQWLQLLQQHQLDYNHSFIQLERYLTDGEDSALTQVAGDWLQDYKKAVNGKPDLTMMRQVNPVVTLRTHHLHEVIAAAESDNDEPLKHYLGALTTPFDRQWLDSNWATPPAAEQQVGQLSCSS